MDKGKDVVKLYATPKLRRPRLVAAWSGMGAVAILTVNYMRQELGAQDLGEIDPHHFFSPSQVVIKDRLLQLPEFPEGKFYFCQTGAAHDLIFFVGSDQPSRGYDLALLILETVKGFGVERIYTTAAFPTLIHHSQDPGVWGTATLTQATPTPYIFALLAALVAYIALAGKGRSRPAPHGPNRAAP